MTSFTPVLLIALSLLSITVLVEGKERFRIKFFRFQGPNCEKMIDNDGSSVKASHSELSADCHEYHHYFDGFMYYWQDHHFRGQTGSMEFGKCQIVVYSDRKCKKDAVCHVAEANFQHNFEQCADFKGRRGQSFKVWCDKWSSVDHH
ncbi:hypothetical protein AC579_10589 [Pseudocercospora musae]|uniref:Cyanovirin-N domain-containing protein n=1 Tax=Pseudocercospora musae TaxID=113226 RepID=A0A139IL35_9PEZI|nr:hypothetical protein AC579_10589 [Pseudocercospora musae]KXT15459.1 hypothetical protein AC579_10589 [Pseudocercospora musae]KXT15460.1 hypothetical protein AC579_10589 [Pseudocercospora musae]KXT15461.1 hypothetical protein AC579_10589 [Pseudocercospora musae]